MQPAKLRTLIYASCGAMGVIVVTHQMCFAPDTYSFGFLAYDRVSPDTVTATTSITKKPPHCTDPYREPGLFYYPADTTTSNNPNTTDRTESRWIPYTDAFWDLPDPEQATWPAEQDAIFHADSVPPALALERAPGNWMKRVVTYNADRTEADFDMSWMQDRRVLMVGDSLLRQEGEHFCAEVGEEWRCEVGGHKVCVCHLSSLNFTIANWHLPSMYTFKNESWWWINGMKPVDFESRYEEFWAPTLPHINGLSAVSPDLILFQSGHWDERAARQHAKSISEDNYLASFRRHLTWEEATFFSARMKKFITFLKELFGDDAPVMYHSLTAKVMKDTAMNVGILDLDKINRFLAKRNNIEVFEWAGMIRGHEWFFKDSVHPARSPVSWLWGNMVLHYLFRATGGVEVDGKVERLPKKGWNGFGGWLECHPWNV